MSYLSFPSLSYQFCYLLSYRVSCLILSFLIHISLSIYLTVYLSAYPFIYVMDYLHLPSLSYLYILSILSIFSILSVISILSILSMLFIFSILSYRVSLIYYIILSCLILWCLVFSFLYAHLPIYLSTHASIDRSQHLLMAVQQRFQHRGLGDFPTRPQQLEGRLVVCIHLRRVLPWGNV